MRCIVTGVAGFVGSHLAERLVAEGHEVLGIDAFISSYPRELKEANLEALRRSSRFQFMEGDLNEIDLPAVLTEREWVFHQAGQAGVRTSWGQHFSVYAQCNILATQRLLEAAAHSPYLKRLVFASSSSVYGKTAELPLTEADVAVAGLTVRCNQAGRRAPLHALLAQLWSAGRGAAVLYRVRAPAASGHVLSHIRQGSPCRPIHRYLR